MAGAFARAAVVAAATGIVLVLLLPSAGNALRLAAPLQPSLTDLRLCEGKFFDRRQNRCTKDQRGTPLRSSAFFCSVTVRVPPGATLRRGVWLREQPVHRDE